MPYDCFVRLGVSFRYRKSDEEKGENYFDMITTGVSIIPSVLAVEKRERIQVDFRLWLVLDFSGFSSDTCLLPVKLTSIRSLFHSMIAWMAR